MIFFSIPKNPIGLETRDSPEILRNLKQRKIRFYIRNIIIVNRKLLGTLNKNIIQTIAPYVDAFSADIALYVASRLVVSRFQPPENGL